MLCGEGATRSLLPARPPELSSSSVLAPGSGLPARPSLPWVSLTKASTKHLQPCGWPGIPRVARSQETLLGKWH